MCIYSYHRGSYNGDHCLGKIKRDISWGLLGVMHCFAEIVSKKHPVINTPDVFS
jgi:hypothetical protein